jgi:hypothetical protein
MSNSRLEPLNRGGVKVGQCVSPAPFSAAPFPVYVILDGAGETHCPTLRFMGRALGRASLEMPARLDLSQTED